MCRALAGLKMKAAGPDVHEAPNAGTGEAVGDM